MLVGSLAQEAPIDVPLIIEEHEKLVDELTVVKDLVEPCFPPKYHIFDLFAATYHGHLVELVHVSLFGHSSSRCATVCAKTRQAGRRNQLPRSS